MYSIEIRGPVSAKFRSRSLAQGANAVSVPMRLMPGRMTKARRDGRGDNPEEWIMSEKELDYATLLNAGNERYCFSRRNRIAYPDGEVVDWYGYRRHNFELDGRKGFIVEPPHPAAGLPWSWCLQWADSFVPRTPALKLLERGFHHVHFDVFPTYMNEEGVRALEKFYALLQSMHFHKKAALFGMSYGGLFSLRWAAEHPETVGVMWLDAPVCSLAFAAERNESNASPADLERYRGEARKHLAAYRAADCEGLVRHPLNPLNNVLPIARAGIPILAIRSGQDQTVLPASNIDVLEKRLLAAGGKIHVIRRDFYGHHPHGLDDPAPLADFILQYYPELPDPEAVGGR